MSLDGDEKDSTQKLLQTMSYFSPTYNVRRAIWELCANIIFHNNKNMQKAKSKQKWTKISCQRHQNDVCTANKEHRTNLFCRTEYWTIQNENKVPSSHRRLLWVGETAKIFQNDRYSTFNCMPIENSLCYVSSDSTSGIAVRNNLK